MPLFRTSSWARIALGIAVFVAGIVLFVARPGIALAHHIEIHDEIDCESWETSAVYIGGDDDRKVVVDVVINGEVIQQEFYFDNEPGHLGHQDEYVLYTRTGTGTLLTSGTITMYERDGDDDYTIDADSDYTDINLDCDDEEVATATPVAPTSTPQPENTPETPATNTAVPQPTGTPLAEETPAATSTAVPTATPSGPSPTDTPDTNEPDSTPEGPGGPTPEGPGSAVVSTPTMTSSVLGFVPQPPASQAPPAQQGAPPEGTASSLPSAGQPAASPQGVVMGLLGTALAAAGLVIAGRGMRMATRR
jgi:hypothetical protein